MMKNHAALLLASLTVFLLTTVSRAMLPDGTQVVQAESMVLDGDGWTVREHDLDSYSIAKPFGRMICGQNVDVGTATTTLTIPTAGKYRVWVRYLDLVDYRLVTELQGSQASLDMANATPAVAGKLPREFPFTTGMKLTPDQSTAEAISREHEALRRIGVTDDHSRPSSFCLDLTKTLSCLSQPDMQRIDATIQDLAQKHPDHSDWSMINLMGKRFQ